MATHDSDTTKSAWDSLLSTGGDAIQMVEGLLQSTFGIALVLLVYAVAFYLFYNAFLSAAALLLPLYRSTLLGRFVSKNTSQVDPKSIVETTLSELGYSSHKLEAMRAANARQHYQVLGMTNDEVISRLLTVLADNTASFGYEIAYGETTPNKSKYYVDTMSAALSESYLSEMAELMRFVVSQRKAGARPIDFVLAPKTGNVLLALAVSQKLAARCIYRKGDANNSRARSGEQSVGRKAAETRNVNLEGFQALLEHAKERSGPLYGICIDCNCSGGGEIARTIQEYNTTARSLPDYFSSMEEAFVLYRPDRSKMKSQCEDGQGISIERLFDLTEGQKKTLAGTPTDDEIGKLAKQVKKV